MSNVVTHDFRTPCRAETDAQIASKLRKKALKVIAKGLRTEKGIALLGFAKLALDVASKDVVVDAEILEIGFDNGNQNANKDAASA